jgi:hypothetical protein
MRKTLLMNVSEELQQYLETRIATVVMPRGEGIPVEAVPSVITCRGLVLR